MAHAIDLIRSVEELTDDRPEVSRKAGLTPIFMNPKDNLQPPEGVVKICRLSELLPLLGINDE